MKRLRSSLFLVCCAVIVNAQHTDFRYTSRFSFGATLEAGYTGARDHEVTENPGFLGQTIYTTSEERHPGYALGVWGIYWLNPHWELELGVNFGTWRAYAQGEWETINLAGGTIFYGRERFWVDQDLLRIPLQMRHYLGKPTNRVRPFIAFGTQLAYLSRQDNFRHNYYTAPGQDPTENEFSSTADLAADWVEVKRWQWSVLGGIGVQLHRVSLSIHQNWPFTNLLQNDSRLDRYYPTLCPSTVNSPGEVPTSCINQVNHFRQTSLRFQYRIF